MRLVGYLKKSITTHGNMNIKCADRVIRVTWSYSN